MKIVFESVLDQGISSFLGRRGRHGCATEDGCHLCHATAAPPIDQSSLCDSIALQVSASCTSQWQRRGSASVQRPIVRLDERIGRAACSTRFAVVVAPPRCHNQQTVSLVEWCNQRSVIALIEGRWMAAKNSINHHPGERKCRCVVLAKNLFSGTCPDFLRDGSRSLQDGWLSGTQHRRIRTSRSVDWLAGKSFPTPIDPP